MSIVRTLMRGSMVPIEIRRAIVGPRRPTWSVQLETLAEVMRQSAKVGPLMPVAAYRKFIDAPRPKTPPMRATSLKKTTLGSVPCAEITTDNVDDRVIFYIHGGGYSTGSLGSHRDLVSRLCLDAKMRVVFPIYRLAPEHPFPAGLDDVYAVYRALLETGVDPNKIAFCGDSAGGGLCIALAYRLRDANEPLPGAIALISGWLNLASDGDTMQSNSKYDYVLRGAMITCAKRYAPKSQWKRSARLAAVRRSQRTSPLLVHAGEVETLLSDNRRFAEKRLPPASTPSSKCGPT
ncbi:MAG: alpha/beta hydrolase [Polyangiales bacterium]